MKIGTGLIVGLRSEEESGRWKSEGWRRKEEGRGKEGDEELFSESRQEDVTAKNRMLSEWKRTRQ
jgi:hypothetical protein